MKAVIALWLVLTCLGSRPPRAWAQARPTHAPIFAGPHRLFDVGALPGQSAADRAAAINRRIDSFVRHPARIAPVEMRAAFDAAGLDIYPSGVQVMQLRSPEPAGPGQGPPSPPAPAGNEGAG
jgi:hypothetical protein